MLRRGSIQDESIRSKGRRRVGRDEFEQRVSATRPSGFFGVPIQLDNAIVSRIVCCHRKPCKGWGGWGGERRAQSRRTFLGSTRLNCALEVGLRCNTLLARACFLQSIALPVLALRHTPRFPQVDDPICYLREAGHDPACCCRLAFGRLLKRTVAVSPARAPAKKRPRRGKRSLTLDATRSLPREDPPRRNTLVNC